MNLREGRVGLRETSAIVLIACLIGGVFSMNTQRVYQNGNSIYLSTILSAGFSLLLFYFVADSMRKKNCKNLASLYRFAFGKVLAIPIMMITVLAMIYAAVSPLIKNLLILCRYVYVDSDFKQVALYFVPCLLVFTWMGLETITRTAKIFWFLIVLSFVAAFVIAGPAFESYRLYPLLGNGIVDLLTIAVEGIARFFPALIALLICGVGVQGLDCAATAAGAGTLGGGLLAAGSQFCLGMTYSSKVLSSMHAPMYRATMSVRTGSAYLRTDKLLLFFWTAGGLLAGGFFAYAGSLLYAQTMRIQDIRPVGAAISLTICTLVCIAYEHTDWFDATMKFLWVYAWAIMLIPPVLAAAIALLKRRRTA